MRLPKTFRRKSDGLPPWAALDQESLRISAAMEHVQDHGNLDAFPGDNNEKMALMLTASRQGLVTWNRETQRYELTNIGRERLGMRKILRTPGDRMNLTPSDRMNLPAGAAAQRTRWALGSGTIMAGIAGVAIGAAAMALLPGSSSKPPPRDRAAVATSAKPADTKSKAADAKSPRETAPAPSPAPRETAQAQSPASPAPAPTPAPQEQASAAAPAATAPPAPPARNPGIPCVAGKCLETGGTREQPTQPGSEHVANAPPAPTSPAPQATSSKPEPQKAQQDATHETKAPAAAGGNGSHEAATREQAPTGTAAKEPAPSHAPAASQPASAANVSSAPAPKPQPPRHSTRRAPPREVAPAPVAEQPGYAQSTGESARAATKSSRHRQAATEQRKISKSRRDYAQEDDEPRSDVMVRRYEPDDPPVVMRRSRGDPDRRRGWDERDRPGYAYREQPRFGDQQGPPRFGLFDWLFH